MRIEVNLIFQVQEIVWVTTHGGDTCLMMSDDSGGSRGRQIRPWPPIEVGNGVWPPIGGRKCNDSIVNLPKSNDFGPPVSLSATDLVPIRKNTTLKHKKVIRNLGR